MYLLYTHFAPIESKTYTGVLCRWSGEYLHLVGTLKACLRRLPRNGLCAPRSADVANRSQLNSGRRGNAQPSLARHQYPFYTCVGSHEAGEMAAELFVAVVVKAFDGRLLDRAVHALDLAVGPGVVRLR